MNARIWIVLLAVLGPTTLGGAERQAVPAPASAAPASAAARSQDEMMSFVRSAAATSPERVRVITMTGGTGGRELPLVVIGTNLADGSAKTIRATDKIRVWVHAGSRDGTDAALKLIGEMAAGRNELWLTSMILLVSPVDLTRGAPASAGGDQIRLTSPDTLAVTRTLVEFDPHVNIEIKTEDGPCSAYAMTFSPPLNPITSEHILVLLRDEWFPFVVRNLKQKWSMNAFYRGVVEGGDDGCSAKPVEKAAAAPAARRGQPPASAPAARGTRTTGRGAATAKPEAAPPPPEITWAAPSHLLGLTANYMGARNRVGIAGVLHARDTAGERADAANRFLEEALGFAWAASVRIKKATEDAEKQLLVGRSLPTSARPMTIGQVEVLMSAPSPDGAAKRTASPVAVTMRDRLRFEPASDEVVAAEYFIPAGETAIVDLLRNHGIAVRQITQPTKGVEEFVEAKGAAGGPASPRLSGSWQASQAEVPAGSWVVRMNQPLARLAFALIEPTSDESVATFLRGDDGHPYAIMRRR